MYTQVGEREGGRRVGEVNTSRLDTVRTSLSVGCDKRAEETSAYTRGSLSVPWTFTVLSFVFASRRRRESEPNPKVRSRMVWSVR